jgi:hypothetical protein
MELKYVVTENNDFAIFSKATKHSNIARVLHGVPVGAGFCTIRQKADSMDVDAHCYGNSVSLLLHSRPKVDEDIINTALNSY